MRIFNIEAGQKFNYLTVVKEVAPFFNSKGKAPKRRFLCECDCGKLVCVRFDSLRNNKKSSCGCMPSIPIVKTGNPVLKHGLCKEVLYKIWKGIRGRCYSETNRNYHRYGGRGITMCNSWYTDVSLFIEWSLNNGYKVGLQCDRRDNDKGYSPDNCRWVTSEVNNNNKSSNIKYEFDGHLLTLPQISKLTGIGFPTLYRRINENKLSLEEALSIPINGKCKKEYEQYNRGLTKEAVEYIFYSKDKYSDIAEKYKTSDATIWRIKNKLSYLDIVQNLNHLN